VTAEGAPGDGGASTAGAGTVAPNAPAADVPLTLQREIARKALHITSVIVPVAYATGALPRRVLVAVVLTLLGVALAVELGRARSERVRAHFTRAAGALLRAHEHHRWAGATWLLVAFALALVLFPPAVAIAATWAVSLGDASAAVVGRAFGRHRFPGSGKSVEGSVACAIATFVGASLVAQLALGASVVAALTAAIAEAPRRPLDDNVRVALAVGGGILLWRMAFS
jgi:dolichol kinase